MQFDRLAIADVIAITPRKFSDARGFFSETYNSRALAQLGLEADFVQDNHSLSTETGTIRGLHFQTPPAVQGKLVRVVRGAVYDVAVDLRRGSPSYGEHVGMRLDAEAGTQLWVPGGFAHGFCTLEPDTEVVYKVTGFYTPDCDSGLAHDDPDLAIDWPLEGIEAVLSDKDQGLPRFADFDTPFDV